MRNKKLLWTAAASAGVLAVGGSVTYAAANSATAVEPSPSNECAVSELEVPDGAAVDGVEAVSPSGDFAVANADGAVVLWQDGVPTFLDESIPAGSQVAAVNSSGAVFGNAGADQSTAWMYAEGEVTDLVGPEGATEVEVRGVNDDGVIVGQASTDDSDYPVRWTDPAAAAEPLPLPEDAKADVVDVDAEGTAVGHMRSAETDDVKVGWTWPSEGDGEALPSYPDEEFYSDIVAVSGEWALTMSVIDSEGPQHYHRLSLTGESDPVELRLGDGDAETDRDVWAIDHEGRAFGADADGQPAVQSGDEVSALPVVEGSETGNVYAVSAAGSVAAGGATDSDGDVVPVMWTQC